MPNLIPLIFLRNSCGLFQLWHIFGFTQGPRTTATQQEQGLGVVAARIQKTQAQEAQKTLLGTDAVKPLGVAADQNQALAGYLGQVSARLLTGNQEGLVSALWCWVHIGQVVL